MYFGFKVSIFLFLVSCYSDKALQKLYQLVSDLVVVPVLRWRRIVIIFVAVIGALPRWIYIKIKYLDKKIL